MTFSLENFIEEIFNQFDAKLNRKEIESLLDLKDQYSKDTPISTGKRLIVTNLAFKGIKKTDTQSEYSNNPIDFSQPIYTGINIWIADNFKGKSSIFKIIKYALTGNSSLKTNIKSWINEIILNFKISDKPYTIYLNTEKRLKAYLLNGTYTSYDDIAANSSEAVIDARSEAEYQQQIQEFFFKQFSYYTLKWTQKHPSKDKNELMEVGSTWSTYFMSMLLESKDSGEMYGAQGKKIFEMLLGLELTYPINRLKVKADLLNDQKAKDSIYRERILTSTNNKIETLNLELEEVNRKIIEQESVSQTTESLGDLIEQYNGLVAQIRDKNDQIIKAESNIQSSNNLLQKTRDIQNNNYREKRRLHEETSKVKRNLLDLREYVEIGIFFSNLDIKHCPNCSQEISEKKKKEVIVSQKCYVCDHSIKDSTQNEDPEVYLEKIANLEKVLNDYQSEIERIEENEKELQETFDQQFSHIEELKAVRKTEGSISELTNDLKELEEKINAEKSKHDYREQNRLISEKAVLEYQIKQLQDSSTKEIEVPDIDIKIKVVKYCNFFQLQL